jgi:probable HAF family extracellular repeat protein
MNNYGFYAQQIEQKAGKNVRTLDYGCATGGNVKALLRHSARSWFTPSLSAFIFCAGLALASERLEAASTIVELAVDLTEASGASVRGLNDNGEVVGGGQDSGRHRGFLLRDDGTRLNFNGLEGSDFSVARGINLAGQIVGSANTQTGIQAYRSLRGSAGLPLKSLSGDSSSVAFAISDSGEAVGYSSGPNGQRAVRWSSVGIPQALPILPDSRSGRALAVNKLGNTVGVSEVQGASRAVLWKGDSAKDLGALPGQFESEAHAINNGGDIVGFSVDRLTERRHAVLWTSYGDGPIQDLGTLQGGASSWALGINNRGQVIGTSQTKDGSFHAFLWTPESGMQDLNDLVATTLPPGIILVDAISINSPGQILAIGRKNDLPDSPEDEVKLDIFLVKP